MTTEKTTPEETRIQVVENRFATDRLAITKEVTAFFRKRPAGISREIAADFPATWAPGAGASMAPVPIAGHLPEAEAPMTDDSRLLGNLFAWYDLEGQGRRMGVQDLLYPFDLALYLPGEGLAPGPDAGRVGRHARFVNMRLLRPASAGTRNDR